MVTTWGLRSPGGRRELRWEKGEVPRWEKGAQPCSGRFLIDTTEMNLRILKRGTSRDFFREARRFIATKEDTYSKGGERGDPRVRPPGVSQASAFKGNLVNKHEKHGGGIVSMTWIPSITEHRAGLGGLVLTS